MKYLHVLSKLLKALLQVQNLKIEFHLGTFGIVGELLGKEGNYLYGNTSHIVVCVTCNVTYVKIVHVPFSRGCKLQKA